MKRKYADLSHWSNRPINIYRQKYIEDFDFKGHICLVKFENIINPITFCIGKEQELVIIDNQYTWLEHFPLEGNHILTTVINNNGEVVQHYFDVILGSCSLTSEGLPFFDDLFIDVILLSNNEIYILDENELIDAKNNKEITIDQYNIAIREMTNLKNTLMDERNILIKRWERDYKTLQDIL